MSRCASGTGAGVGVVPLAPGCVVRGSVRRAGSRRARRSGSVGEGASSDGSGDARRPFVGSEGSRRRRDHVVHDVVNESLRLALSMVHRHCRRNRHSLVGDGWLLVVVGVEVVLVIQLLSGDGVGLRRGGRSAECSLPALVTRVPRWKRVLLTFWIVGSAKPAGGTSPTGPRVWAGDPQALAVSLWRREVDISVNLSATDVVRCGMTDSPAV